MAPLFITKLLLVVQDEKNENDKKTQTGVGLVEVMIALLLLGGSSRICCIASSGNFSK
jgi:hypothetical protein